MSGRRFPRSVPPETHTAAVDRVLHITIIMLTAILVGGVAGLLSRADGASAPHALLTAGDSLAGTTALLMGLAQYARAR
jgi:hypothetical protein